MQGKMVLPVGDPYRRSAGMATTNRTLNHGRNAVSPGLSLRLEEVVMSVGDKFRELVDSGSGGDSVMHFVRVAQMLSLVAVFSDVIAGAVQRLVDQDGGRNKYLDALNTDALQNLSRELRLWREAANAKVMAEFKQRN